MSDGGDDRADGGASSPHDTPAPSAPAVLREDQLTNAVAFLSHPKVRRQVEGLHVLGCRRSPLPPTPHLTPPCLRLSVPPACQVRSSSAASKREFLQKKGLTQAEIEEAFRRVPQPPPGQEPQPAALPAAAPSAVASTLQHLQPQPLVTYAGQQQGGPAGGYMPPGQHMQMMQQQPQQGVRWTQVGALLRVWGLVLWCSMGKVRGERRLRPQCASQPSGAGRDRAQRCCRWLPG